MQESSQLFLMLKCNTLHVEHSVERQNEVNQRLQGEDFQPDTQSHTGLLVWSVSQ